MRKLILELEPNEMIRNVQKPVFENIHSYELLEMLRIDWEEGVKIGLMECHCKDGIPIEDVNLPDNVKILNVLKSEDDVHTCIVRVNVPEEFTQLMAKFKLILIWTTPTLISENSPVKVLNHL